MNLILKFRSKELVNEFCDLRVRKEVLDHYKRRVGENEDGSNIRVYENEVIYIENRKGCFEFEYDKKKKKILDKIFGL